MGQDEKLEFPEPRVHYECEETPMPRSVFEFREQKKSESWFDWMLYYCRILFWYYEVDKTKPISKQFSQQE